jgi:hypothetical protein
VGSLVVQDIDVSESDKEMVGRDTLGIDSDTTVEVPRPRMAPQTNTPHRPRFASVTQQNVSSSSREAFIGQ